MPPHLLTARLTLAPLAPEMAEDIAAGADDREVVRWLTRLPFPYGQGDALRFVETCREGPAWAIRHRHAVIGMVAADDGLGYWLRRDAWGRGLAREAARRVVDFHFSEGGGDLASSFMDGNAASARILRGLGFEDDGPKVLRSLAAGERPGRAMLLTRAAWEARTGLPIRTERLTLDLMRDADAEALHAMVTIPEVGRNLMVFPPWWTVAAARTFIPLCGDLSGPRYRLAVRRDGRLIGSVGFGAPAGGAVGLAYWLHPDAAGQGFATETARAAILDFLRRFPDRDALVAGVFQDNPASARVLKKLGFRRTGESVRQGDARMDPAPLWDYRLERAALEGRS
ncbi:RimJ/RimL family protein N-acetyltransferase [Hasllibacter halocynthiae]|uniref:RimJ/RimL family protein N-acetyltransferase n=1 Tax=Hasllibacter halocynthiae TaxID=595589 RepID=A0A2T0X8D5_9RHOB|nr:GNAT family N-acetyltransferase [Hasllibacter halocynthiae]PRY95210.1 RimJ/RimL family protein N-acetyltransferase [Hasllibacter halocynthiae]